MSTNTTQYYNQNASTYDALHGGDRNPEHIRALELAWPFFERLRPSSFVEVGCGTGRSIEWVRSRMPDAKLIGIDPSIELLAIAKRRHQSVDFVIGNGERLPVGDGFADVVIATGIMHHVDSPSKVISEMFRVAKMLVVISDHNNFAFGGQRTRRLRLLLYAMGLLPLITYVKQGFKRQGYTEEDGWWYPYSLLNNFDELSRLSSELFVAPTRRATPDENCFMLAQSHLVIIAAKRGAPELGSRS